MWTWILLMNIFAKSDVQNRVYYTILYRIYSCMTYILSNMNSIFQRTKKLCRLDKARVRIPVAVNPLYSFVNETTIIIIRAFKYFLIFLMYKNISWKFPLRIFTAPYPTPQRKWILSTFSEVWNTNLPKWRRRGFCESSTRTDSISSINRRTWDNTSPRKLSCLNDDNEQ